MTATQKYLLTAYSAALAGKTAPPPEDGVDIKGLYELAVAQGVASAVYYSLKDCSALPQEARLRFEDAHNKAVMQDLQREEEEKRVFARLDKSDINYLPLKGSVMRVYYPSTDMRVMGDTDIMIDKYARAEVRTAMADCGYAFKDSHSGHDIYKHENGNVFEVHWKPADGSDFHAKLMERAVPIGDRGNRLSLNLSDFYLYMISHVARHVRTGGAGLRMFGDIKVFYSRCGLKMDANYVAVVLEEIGLTVFEKEVKTLLHTLFYDAPADETTADFLDYIFLGGVFGSAENLAANKRGTKSKLGYFMSSAFPSFGRMKERYPFLKYLPFLLPFMWVFRWFALLFKGKKPGARYKMGATVSKDTLKRNKRLMNSLQLKRYKNGKQRMTTGEVLVSLLAIVVLVFAIWFIGRGFIMPEKEKPIDVAIDSSEESSGDIESSDDIPIIEETTFEIPERENGSMIYDDGVYVGEILNGLPDGIGTLTYNSGKVYKGSFSEGKFNGKGKCKYTDGSWYDGYWFEGEINGEGTWYYPDGSKATGTFEGTEIIGKCVYVCPNGDEYEGYIKDGKWHGEGKYVWMNGDVYEGQFVNGIREGQGKYRYADGTVYNGSWIDNEPNGMGTLTEGTVTLTGLFVNGVLEGEGTAKDSSSKGGEYKGYFIHGEYCDDEAVYKFNAGGSYEGAFENGKFHGAGTLTYSDGDKVKGTFVDGELQGRAQYYYNSLKRWKTIYYKDGKPQ